MRIVVDLQVCQAVSAQYNNAVVLNSLALVKGMMALNTRHDFWVIVSGALPQTALREALVDVLPVENIISLEIPTPVAEKNCQNQWRTQAAKHVREFAIAQLNPDILYLSGLFVGFFEDAVVSIPAELTSYPIVANVQGFDQSVFNLQDSEPQSIEAKYRETILEWHTQKLAELNHASALLSPQGELCQSLDSASNHKDDTRPLSPTKAIKVLEQTHRCFLIEQNSHASVVPSKARLAFVSPLPPVQSGISDYSADLLPELAERYDIVLITSQPTVDISISDMSVNIIVRDLDWFSQHAETFTRIVYHFGNSPFHQQMFALLHEYPGIVVLHDFYLSNLLYWMVSQRLLSSDFSQVLYDSHGYAALMYLNVEGSEAAASQYPCNRCVLDDAVNVIVHSEHAKRLAKSYFGTYAADTWALVHQPYAAPDEILRQQARERLNFGENDFVLGSFGMLGPTKLNHRLLDAWLASDLASDGQCHLIFVGKNHEGEYGQQLVETIQSSGVQSRVKITGFLDSQQYGYYLAAVDAVVQLRTMSRGETSRAILETLSYGIPLVVNKHGSVKDYPDSIFVGVPDAFRDDELISAITKCRHDEDFRHRMGQLGREYVLNRHSEQQAADEYYSAIEAACAAGSHNNNYRTLVRDIAAIERAVQPDESDLMQLAEAIALTENTAFISQLLLDVSDLMSLKTSRIGESARKAVAQAMAQMLQNPQANHRIEPVYFDGKNYRYARGFTTDLLGLHLDRCVDDILTISSKDYFLGIDSAILAADLPRLSRLSCFANKAVKIHCIRNSERLLLSLFPTQMPKEPLAGWSDDLRQLIQPWVKLLTSILTFPPPPG